MVRTQIQLEDVQIAGLKRLSAQRKRSMADLIREGVEHVLKTANRESRIERARAVAGKFSSGVHDISENHDRYLAEEDE